MKRQKGGKKRLNVDANKRMDSMADWQVKKQKKANKETSDVKSEGQMKDAGQERIAQ